MISELLQKATTSLDKKAAEIIALKFSDDPNFLDIDSGIASNQPMGYDLTSQAFLYQTPHICRQFFGYNSREEMVAWMSVHWPNLKEEPIETAKKNRTLTEFQKACLTRMFMRTNINIGMLAALVDKSYTM